MAAPTFGLGLVVGKFAPPHLGHIHVIRTALAACERVVVGVIDTPVEGMAWTVHERALWLAETVPQAEVRVITDTLLDDRSDLWGEYTTWGLGLQPDAVFGSEPYIDTWAAAMGAVAVQVDPGRTTVPVSATAVRSDPAAHLDLLPEPVRAAHVLRIVVCGAESTGTTTLARDLAADLDEPYVEEYGRLRDEWAAERGDPPPAWTSEEFLHVAVVQKAAEDRLARTATAAVVSDTDAWATALWHERYLDRPAPWILEVARARRERTVYLLTSPEDVPAVQDGYRFEMEKREAMHQRFLDVLPADRTHVLVGTRRQRLQRAREVVAPLLGR